MGGLRLDSREALLKAAVRGRRSFPATRQEPDLIQAVRQTGEKLKMPKGGGWARMRSALAEWVRRARVARRADDQPRRLRRPPRPRTAAPTAPAYVIKPEQRRVLVVSAAAQGAGALRFGYGVAENRHRSLRAGAASSARAEAGPRRRQTDADPPSDARPHRAAADAGRDRRVRRRHGAGRVRQGGRSPPRVAPLR
jgi:hypothetical protein